MKKLILLLSICIIAISCNLSQKTKEETSFNIEGEIIGSNNGMVYLQYDYENVTTKDSINIVNGKFLFKGIVPETIFSSIRIPNANIFIPLFIENKSIKIHIGDSSNRTIEFKDSEINNIYKEWQIAWGSIREKAGNIYQRLEQAYVSEGRKPGDRNFKLSKEKQKGFDAEFAALNTETDSVVFPLARKYPNSVAIAFIIEDRYITWNAPEKARKLFPLLSDNVKNSVYGRNIKNALDLAEKTAIGIEAMDFTMTDVNGKPITLSDFRGKYVLVDFWASWCGPCRKENPNVVKAYQKFHSKGFEILGVSLDSKKEAWIKAIEKDNLTWSHVSDLKGWNNAAAKLYGIKTVPSNFLVNPTGKIIAKDLRGEDLEKKLEKLLN